MRILLVADGGGAMGVGHIARSVALAQEAVLRGHQVHLTGQVEGDLAGRLMASSGGQTVTEPDPSSYDIVHLDSYDRPTPDIAGAATVTSRMHDGSFGQFEAHLLIDPTPGAPSATGADGVRLGGPRYAPLRTDVRHRAVRGRSPVEGPARVVVLMGGTDPQALAAPVRAALAAIGEPVEILGPGPTLLDDLASCDLVVSAAGTTVFEAALLGAPMALVCAVDNQRRGYDALVTSGSAHPLGSAAWVADPGNRGLLSDQLGRLVSDPVALAGLAERARSLVDGLGAWRVVSAWESLVAAAHPAAEVARRRSTQGAAVAVRPATMADAGVLLAWRNDPVTRAMSRSTEPVAWTAHRAWLEACLDQSDRLLRVGSDTRGLLGTVRWDRSSGQDWEVSITVAPSRRGTGVGLALLRSATSWLAADQSRPATSLVAHVHEGNDPSARLFAAAGYLPDLPADAEGFARLRRPLSGPPS